MDATNSLSLRGGAPTIPTVMEAAVIDGAGSAPTLRTRPVPSVGPGDVLVRVLACGVCGSDLFLAEGGFGNVFPVVPGHEAAGEVVAAGADVPASAVGTLVGLYYIDNDPESRWVRTGKPNLGPAVRRMGVDTDGALAQYVARPWESCVIPPDDIDPITLAVLTDALATPYHALTAVGRVGRGETVVVIGVGGIGSNAIQLARLFGARVIAVARSERSRALAAELGAHVVLDGAGDLARQVGRAVPDGVDVVVQCADGPGMDEVAVRLAGPGGRVVLVAASREKIGMASVDLIWRELQVSGSRGFTPDDIRAVQRLYLQGRLEVGHLIGDVRPLSDVSAAFEDLRAGRTTRVVITPN